MKSFLARCPFKVYPGREFRLELLGRFWSSLPQSAHSGSKEKVSPQQRRGSKFLLCGSWVDVLLPAAAVLSISPSLPLRTPPALLLAQRQLSWETSRREPAATLTYTCSGHKLMKCTHFWGLLANTCALVRTRTHIIANRATLTNTPVH